MLDLQSCEPWGLAAFCAEGWARLPAVAQSRAVEKFKREVLAAPTRRVTVGNSGEQWSEYRVGVDSDLGQLLTSKQVFAWAQSVVDVRLKPGPAMWAQSYAAGERIAWHCDNDGEVQFLLCIESPPEDQGGLFCMRVKSGEICLRLAQGDAVLFRASRIPHSTTRLVALPGRSGPTRITAVARFFAEAE